MSSFAAPPRQLRTQFQVRPVPQKEQECLGAAAALSGGRMLTPNASQLLVPCGKMLKPPSSTSLQDAQRAALERRHNRSSLIRLRRRLEREARDPRSSIVPYTTDRVLTSSYFNNDIGRSEPFLTIMDMVCTATHIEVVPMWTRDDSGAAVVCGHYFLPGRDQDKISPNVDIAENTEAFQIGIPVDSVIEQIENAEAPVLTLLYMTRDDVDGPREEEERRLSVVAACMRAKGLNQGGEAYANRIMQRDLNNRLENFEWREGVEFVLATAPDARPRIEIRPEALAGYIANGGQLW
jgi:hypothetical protein